MFERLKFLRWRKEEAPSKCKHIFELVDSKSDEVCCICDKVLGIEEKYKCKICNKITYEHERVEEHRFIDTYYISKGVYGYDIERRYLCLEDYDKFKKYVSRFKDRLGSVETYDLKFTDYEAIKMMNTESAIAYVARYVEFISKPENYTLYKKGGDQEYGISFCAKPKDPLEKPKLIFMPYSALIDEFKMIQTRSMK